MAFTNVTVTGTFHKADGSLATGSVLARPSTELQNGTTVIDTTASVGAIVNGALSMVLVATDDTGTTPGGAYYTWIVQYDGQGIVESFTAPLSHLTSPVDFATFAPIVTSPPLSATFSLGALDARYAPAGSTAPFLNVKSTPFSAVGDGSTDDTAAIQAAINAATGSGGAIVYFPAGTYRITSALTMNDRAGLALIGDSGGGSDSQLARLIYTAAGAGNAIQIHSTRGVLIRGLRIEYNSATYTGSLIDCDWGAGSSDVQFLSIENCWIGGLGQTGAKTCLRLNKVINSTISNVQFVNAQRLVYLGDTDYVNVVAFRGCRFNNAVLISVYQNGAVSGIAFDTCTFEPLTSGAAGAYTNSGTLVASGLSFTNGCWFGDTTLAGGTWITCKPNAMMISGAYVGASTFASFLSLAAGSGGVALMGNIISAATVTAIATAATVTGLTMVGNAFGTGTHITAANVSGLVAIGNSGLTGAESPLILAGNIQVSNSLGIFTDVLSGYSVNLVTIGAADLALNTVGRGLRVKEGSNAKQGVTSAMSGGTLVVNNSSVTANSRIIVTRQDGGTNPGAVYVSARVNATSFTVTSTNGADTGTVAFQIFEPA